MVCVMFDKVTPFGLGCFENNAVSAEIIFESSARSVSGDAGAGAWGCGVRRRDDKRGASRTGE